MTTLLSRLPKAAPMTLAAFIASRLDELRDPVNRMVIRSSDTTAALLEGRTGRGAWFPVFAEIPENDVAAWVQSASETIADELLAYHGDYQAQLFCDDTAAESLFDKLEDLARAEAERDGVAIRD